MSKNKYILFSDLSSNNLGVIIKTTNMVDKSVLNLILTNIHKFGFFIIDYNHSYISSNKSENRLIIEDYMSFFYFKIFLNSATLKKEGYRYLFSVNSNVEPERLLVNSIGKRYNYESALSVVFLLIAMNKVVLGVKVASYIKSQGEYVEVNRWFNKILYDYSDRHDVISNAYSDNLPFLMNKGNKLYRNKNYDAAKNYFDKVVYLHGRRDYTLKLGLACRAAYDFEKAVIVFNGYIRLNPDDFKGYYFRALTSLSLMRYNEAKVYLEVAIKNHPIRNLSAKEVVLNTGRYIYDVLKNKEALEFQRLPDFDSLRLKSYIEYTNIYMILANAQYSLGEYDEVAEQYYKIATTLRPELYTAYERLSEIDNILFEKAVINLDRYLNFLKITLRSSQKIQHTDRLRKYIQALYVTRGRLFILQLDKVNAEKCFNIGMNIHTNIKAREWLAYLYLWSHKYEESLSLYEDILEEKPNRFGVINNIIRVYLEQNKIQEAGEYISKYYDFLTKEQNKDRSHLVRRIYYYAKKDIENGWLVYRDRKICDALTYDTKIHYTHNIFSRENKLKKTFVLAEWGPGDELRWATVYPEIKSKVPNLTIGCEPRLYSLLMRSFPDIKFIPINKRIRGAIKVDQINYIAKVSNSVLTQVLDSASYSLAQTMDQVTLISDVLGEIRKNETSFTKHSGLIKVDLECLQEMQLWLQSLPKNCLNIGVSWKSGLIDVARSVHYSELDLWEKVFKLEDVNFINLQYANYQQDIDNVKRDWGVEVFTPPINLKDDFENVAALMKQLDLVIAPCTVTTELGGMLGVDTVMFSNSPEVDWRVKYDASDIWHSSVYHIRSVRGKGNEFAQQSIIEQVHDLIVNRVKNVK